MKMAKAKTGWFIGIIMIFILLTIGAIVKQIGMETNTIIGVIVIVATPFVFLLWNSEKKQREENIPYNVKRQKFYWRVKSLHSSLR